MNTEAVERARFELRRAFELEASDVVAAQAWPSERDRWAELVFSLLAVTTDTSEDAVRDLVRVMDSLELLDVKLLTELVEATREIDPNDPTVARLVGLMSDYGMTAEEANRAVRTLAQAAAGMSTHFGGKPQRYLRHYGELMVQELGQWFQFTDLPDAKVAYAFTYWLQNGLSMPVSLVDEDMVAFCDEYDITPQDLVAAADERDLNVAVVDDVTQAHMATLRSIAELVETEDEAATDGR